MLGAFVAAGSICCCWEQLLLLGTFVAAGSISAANLHFLHSMPLKLLLGPLSLKWHVLTGWCVGSSTARDHQKLVVAAQGELTKLGVKCWIDIDGGM